MIKKMRRVLPVGPCTLSLKRVRVGERKRPLVPEYLDELMTSYARLGMLQPIVVTTDGTLVSGLHRYTLADRLGLTEIPAVVLDLDALHAELAEIDENVVRQALTQVEHSEQLTRRKEIYLELHPGTKRGFQGGKTGGRGRPKLTGGSPVSYPQAEPSTGESLPPAPVPSFVEDTARVTGRDPSTIRRDVAIGEALGKGLLRQLRGTVIANNKTELQQLAKVPPEKRAGVVGLIVAGDAPTVRAALKKLAPPKVPKITPDPFAKAKEELRSFQSVVQPGELFDGRMAAATTEQLEDFQRVLASVASSFRRAANHVGREVAKRSA